MAEGGVAAVSMDAVAARAGVSRPLLYKHVANRTELLAALYRREAAAVDAEVVAALDGVRGLEAIVRTSVAALLDALGRRAAIVTALTRAESEEPGLQAEQAARLRRSQRFYAQLLTDQLGVDAADAETATALFFSGLETALRLWEARPDEPTRRRVEELVVRFVLGGLQALRPGRASPS